MVDCCSFSQKYDSREMSRSSWLGRYYVESSRIDGRCCILEPNRVLSQGMFDMF